MIKNGKRICMHCNKILVPVASSRKNGTTIYDDWSARMYHKKCYKEKNIPRE